MVSRKWVDKAYGWPNPLAVYISTSFDVSDDDDGTLLLKNEAASPSETPIFTVLCHLVEAAEFLEGDGLDAYNWLTNNKIACDWKILPHPSTLRVTFHHQEDAALFMLTFL